METLIILAVFGLMWSGMGLAFILNPDAAHKGINDALKSPGTSFLIGFLALFIGSLIMVFHMMWGDPLTSLVTFLGILSFIKGIVYLAFPHSVMSMKKGMIPNAQAVRGWGVLVLLLGITFLYLSGYVVL